MRRSAVRLKTILSELQRRRIFKAVAVYGAVAFVVLQVAAIVFPALHLPGWGLTLLVVLAILGFPLVLVFEWVFEFTSEGVCREEPPSSTPTPRSEPGTPAAASGFVRRLWQVALVSLVLAALGREEEALSWLGSVADLGDGGRLFTGPVYLARAGIHERRGDFERAAEEYARFSVLWEGADPELASLRDHARERLAALHGGS